MSRNTPCAIQPPGRKSPLRKSPIEVLRKNAATGFSDGFSKSPFEATSCPLPTSLP